MHEKISILIIDNNKSDLQLIRQYLSEDKSNEYSITSYTEYEKALRDPQKDEFDIIVLSINLENRTEKETLKKTIKKKPLAAIIVLTDRIGEQSEFELIELGVEDYLIRNHYNKELLLKTLKYATSRKRDKNKIVHLYHVLDSIRNINQLITKSKDVKTIITNTCNLLAKTNGYYKVWIILFDKKKKITETAHKGFSASITQFFNDFDKQIYHHCINEVFKKKQPIITTKQSKTCDKCPILDEYSSSSSALTSIIKYNKNTFGLLGVSISGKYVFSKEELQLFNEITRDLGYSLYSIKQEFEKQKLDKKFKEEQKKVNTLVNNIPGLAFRCKYDKQWTMEYLSHACKNLTEYEPEELLQNKSLSFNQIIHPDDQTNVWKTISSLRESQDHYSLEYRIVTKSGNIKWVWENANLIKGKDNKTTYIDGYISEITERKEVLEKIKQSEENFRLIAENSIDCIWKLNLKLRFTYISPSIYNLTGYQPEEWIGHPLSEFSKWIDFAKMARIALRTIRNPIEYSYVTIESRLITKYGNLIPVEITGKALYNENNKLIGLQGSTKDISERIANNKAKVESETKFRALYDNSPDMYVSVSPEDHTIILCNKTLLINLGYTSKNLIGKKVDFLFENTTKKNGAGFQNNSLDIENIRGKELRIVRKDKSTMQASLNIKNIKDEQNKLLYSIFTLRDDTERKLFEDQLKEQNDAIFRQMEEYQALNEEYLNLNNNLNDSNAKLHDINQQLEIAKNRAEESDMLKSAFLANMSHEIRTPMNAILGFSDYLTENNLSEEKRNKFIHIIKSSGNRLLRIINDIIDISKLEAGQLTLVLKNCNVCEIIKDSYETFREYNIYIKRPKVELKLNIPTDEGLCFINTDPGRYQQILDNLLKNAMKFTNQGFIEIGFVKTQYENKTYIQTYVKDTGKGIPKEKQSLIFERFRQIEENEYHEGAGLGLSISKGIVQLLGGDIWLESEPDKGTIFYFTIPIQNENKLISSNSENNITLNGKKSIVIAEDDYISFAYIREIIQESNYQIFHVIDGNELMNILSKITPDLILLDINMPNKNGYDCLKEIRLSKIPVKIIAQTAYAMSEEREKLLSEGCDYYLTKPFSKNELLGAIENVLLKA